MLPKPVVLHVVPEQLEGLLLFPALQERRGEEGGGRGGEDGEGRREGWLQEGRGDGGEEGGVREGRRHNRMPR